ncbi:hypothetical protein Efla_003185 [Eimeria flavescens]
MRWIPERSRRRDSGDHPGGPPRGPPQDPWGPSSLAGLLAALQGPWSPGRLTGAVSLSRRPGLLLHALLQQPVGGSLLSCELHSGWGLVLSPAANCCRSDTSGAGRGPPRGPPSSHGGPPPKQPLRSRRGGMLRLGRPQYQAAADALSEGLAEQLQEAQEAAGVEDVDYRVRQQKAES